MARTKVDHMELLHQEMNNNMTTPVLFPESVEDAPLNYTKQNEQYLKLYPAALQHECQNVRK
jgi:hypothetical protein